MTAQVCVQIFVVSGLVPIELLVENMKNWRLLLHVPVEIINNW